jgi:hypothetical protein
MKAINFLLQTVIIMAGLTAFSSFAEDKPLTRQEKVIQAYEKIKPGTLYGCVVDQSGDPVVQATVTLCWDSLSWVLGGRERHMEQEIITDNEGCFKYKHGKISELFLNASKKGYVLRTKLNRYAVPELNMYDSGVIPA